MNFILLFVQGGEEERCDLSLRMFLPTSYIFSALPQDDSPTFTRVLATIMEEASISFFDPGKSN